MPTAFGADGTAVRQSRTAGYPVPPPIPGRSWSPSFNGNSQYRLPDPETGKLTSYSRASTIAKTLEDTYMLDAWAKRMMLLGIMGSEKLRDTLDHVMTSHVVAYPHRTEGLLMARDLRTELNRISEDAQFAAGSEAAAEFGTAIHAWCEWVDHGCGPIAAVPPMFQPWVYEHRRNLATHQLTVDPVWTERVVLNTRYGIAGTLDRIFRNHKGQLLLGDIKTSRGMEYSWLYFAIQLAVYHGATHMMKVDGSGWEPMPPLDPHTALVMHLPREDIRTHGGKIVPINMIFGADALAQAMTVRAMRSRAEKSAQGVSYALESITRDEQRFYSVRFAVETSRTQADLAALWDVYQDVWTDELTDIGRMILRSAPANAPAERDHT